jgi:hypothetical protein
MRMVSTMFFMVGLVSCGGHSSGGSPQYLVDNKLENPTVGNQPTNQSYLVKTKADIKPCMKDLDGQLIYVIDTKVFFTCQDSDWIEVDIGGKDGINGSDGKDGADTVVSENQWVDPMTGSIVAIGGLTYYSDCNNGWRTIDESENAKEAFAVISHGIIDKIGRLNANKTFWVGPPSNRIFIDIDLMQSTEHTPTTMHTNICIKEGT